MQDRKIAVITGVAAVAALGLVGWQSWNTQQLQQQVTELQQQLQQQVAQATPVPPTSSAPTAPPSSPPADPLWGGQDPFAEMQRMQQQMHQHMQDLMSGFGMGNFGMDPNGSSLFDMDPFQGGLGFGSSMGFGGEPDFDFTETSDNYQVSISIPQGSNVEISTSTQGNNLTIEGKVTVEQDGQNNGGGFRSTQTRQFARTLQLPEDVDPLGVKNETQGDKVVITIPKKKTPQL
ncbi:MAG: Hsp20/alpha crystallin family protein [Pseudomonadota bacterium]